MKRLIWIGGLLGVLTLLALGGALGLGGTAAASPMAARGGAAPPPPAGTPNAPLVATPPPSDGAPDAQPLVACGTPQTFSGSLTNTDPSHTNYINVGGGGVCGVPSTCNIVNVPNYNYNYDLYTFTNPDAAPRAVTVNVTANCFEGVTSFAYLGSFDPANLCANLLSGKNGLDSGSYSFLVPANATFVVTAEEYSPAFGCGSYTLTVTTLCTVCPTNTPTSTPTRTPTVTRTPTPPPCGVPLNFSGSITNSDPYHFHYITSGSACGGPAGCDFHFDQFFQQWHYDLYTFANPDRRPAR